MRVSTGDDATLAGDEARASDRAPHQGWLLPGAPLGRYTVLSRLGAGGMGVVYAAYDAELDRKVALKLLRPSPGVLDESRDREHRLLKQEAQALAKLAHPNVITIHDVGEHEGHVFLAMEFVDGQTLGRWLAQPRPHDWREILAIFGHAGEGLRAAHEAGLIHRDFKPDNVMVGKDGRVRVMDFGLALSAAVLDETADTTGTVGTPAYMAPEQIMGGALDARSDQFSFCVALWEALHGTRPFSGDDLFELADNVEHARIQAPSRPGGAPGWVRRVLVTGLEADPARRHPSMDALLQALRRDPSRARRRLAGALTVLALAGGSWGVMAWSEARAIAACEIESHAIEAEWTSERRTAVERAILAHDVTFAQETWDRLAPALDAYAEEWRATSATACTARRVEQRWSDDLALRASECLDERRAALGALVEVLSGVDLEGLLLANAAVSSLPALEGCADEEALRLRPPPRSDERESALRVRNEAIRGEVEVRAGRQATGQARLEAALVEAQALEDPELVAMIDAALGHLLVAHGEHERGAQHLRSAYFSRGRLGDQDGQLTLAMELTSVEAHLLGRADVAETWLHHASMLHGRLRGPDAVDPIALALARTKWLTARVDYEAAIALARQTLERAEQTLGIDHPDVDAHASTVADIEIRRGHYDAALEITLAGLERHRRVWGDHHPEVARTLINLGTIQSIRGELDAAYAYASEAVSLTEASLGPDHPRTADAVQTLATVLSKQGHLEQAIAAYDRALVVYERSETTQALSVRTVLGGLLVQHRDFERAVTVLEDVLEAQRKRVGPDSSELMTVLINLGAAHRGRGDDDAAASSYREALRLGEAALPVDHPTLAYPLNNLGALEHRRGNLPEARELLSRALEIRLAKLGDAHPLVASTLDALAMVELDEGRAADAIVRLEQAREIMLAKGADPARLTEIEQHLERARAEPTPR